MAAYLVTGGGGFIGSNLTQAILAGGHDVRVLDDFSSGRRENLREAAVWAAQGNARFELLEGDVRDAATCAAALEGVDCVLHHAALPSVRLSVEDPLRSHQVNVEGTLNLLLAGREAGLRRFVYASSSAVYGDRPELPKVETMQPDPVSPYGLQKLSAERYCLLFQRLYDLPVVVLRYFNVFGPRQDPAGEYAAVIPRFVAAAREGRRPTVYGDGEQTRDFVFVDNVVRANLLACSASATATGRAYNIATGAPVSLNELVHRIERIAGVKLAPRRAPERAGDIRHSVGDVALAKSRLGYRVDVDLVEGLRQTWREQVGA